MREAGRAYLAPVRPVGAVGDEVDAELPLGRLDRGVRLARRRADSLRVHLEEQTQNDFLTYGRNGVATYKEKGAVGDLFP